MPGRGDHPLSPWCLDQGWSPKWEELQGLAQPADTSWAHQTIPLWDFSWDQTEGLTGWKVTGLRPGVGIAAENGPKWEGEKDGAAKTD